MRPTGTPSRRWLHVGATLLLSAVSLSAGEAVVLEYKGSPGQALTYQFTCAADAEMKVGGKTMSVASQGSVTVAETIAAVDERKQLTVRFAFPAGNLSSTLNGRVVSTSLEFPPVEITMTPTGNPLQVRALPPRRSADDPPAASSSAPSSPTSFADLFAHLRCLSFPPTAVEVGDSWSVSGVLPRPGGKSVQVTGLSRLTGVEDHRGARCAVIHSQVTIPLDSTRKMLGLTARVTGKATITSTTWFDLTTGRVQELLGTERARRTIHLSADEKKETAEHPPSPPATILLDSTTTFTMALRNTSL